MRIFLLVLLLLSATSRADVVHLKSGGRLAGTVEQSDGEARYRITTPAGTSVTLDRHQVEKVVESSAEGEAYQSRAHAAPDTVEAQLALAKWCKEHNLHEEQQRHAQRVVELDPANAEARQMLNFRNVGGQWMTREQLMASRGLVWYDGKYRTRQEIALREHEKKTKQREAHWSGEIKKWRRWLGDRRPERVQEAIRNFQEVSEPMAAGPIVDLLQDEPDPAVRRLLAKAAANIDHQATVNALVTLSLTDPDTEIRLSALESLVKAQRPGLTEAYVKALKSKENEVVNRAATALGQVGDRSAIRPLIDALVTEHKMVVGGNSGGGDTYSFNSQNGISSFGGGGPKVLRQDVRNPDVLTALVRLSDGEHFGYDASLWKKWFATQARIVQVDLRRDQ